MTKLARFDSVVRMALRRLGQLLISISQIGQYVDDNEPQVVKESVEDVPIVPACSVLIRRHDSRLGRQSFAPCGQPAPNFIRDTRGRIVDLDTIAICDDCAQTKVWKGLALARPTNGKASTATV